eukprot:GHVH01011585.1.p1 GENE.GHVH01011585.1~~GHVH01011585.1.p1  ORF type:complete len:252 (-),score=17.24 GHVH01011585.1:596-1351(-)
MRGLIFRSILVVNSVFGMYSMGLPWFRLIIKEHFSADKVLLCGPIFVWPRDKVHSRYVLEWFRSGHSKDVECISTLSKAIVVWGVISILTEMVLIFFHAQTISDFVVFSRVKRTRNAINSVRYHLMSIIICHVINMIFGYFLFLLAHDRGVAVKVDLLPYPGLLIAFNLITLWSSYFFMHGEDTVECFHNKLIDMLVATRSLETTEDSRQYSNCATTVDAQFQSNSLTQSLTSSFSEYKTARSNEIEENNK